VKKPNLFIVGAAKAGTTALYSYLCKHPDMYFSPIKEPHYFSDDIRIENFQKQESIKACFDINKYLGKKKLEEKHIAFIDNEQNYLNLFRESSNELYLGEASTGYLFSKTAANNIFEFDNNAKIIISLRNPIERAYSHWKMNLASGRENINQKFIDAIERDYNSKEKGYCISNLYIELGMYSSQVERYKSKFNDTIFICFYEDLNNHPFETIDRLSKFLNLPNTLNKDLDKKNVSKISNYPNLKSSLRKIGLHNIIPKFVKEILSDITSNTEFPKLSNDDRIYVYNKFYKKEIDKLEKLLKKDLSHWRYNENI
jgi:hypothetical protein